ncbi:transposase, Mutator family protein [Rhodococcus sp. MTM3W5.2]|nr:transposase, Mutator family protein [Rhodococcus sp. MTM3W5.2]
MSAKGLTTGKIAIHFAEVHDVSVSKDSISPTIDKVVSAMMEWANPPLDQIYPGGVDRCDPLQSS